MDTAGYGPPPDGSSGGPAALPTAFTCISLMSMTNSLIWFLIIGIAAGWLAGKIMRGSGFGLLGDLVIGVVGAMLGGWVFRLLGIGAGGLVGNLVVALAGALLLLYIVRLVKRA